MAQYLASNNASSTTTGAILATDTAIPLLSAAAFPAPSAGDYTLVTLESALGVREIACIVAVVGNTLTVGVPGSAAANVLGRNYENILGMAAAAWDAGTIVSCRPTAAVVAAGKNAADALYVANTPAGGMVATTVQAAINELHTNKVSTTGALTSNTGLPISTGVSGLGANVAAFLAAPSSANLAAALTDETGTGANVFATSPTLVTPNLGTPSAAILTNATGTAVGLTAGSATNANNIFNASFELGTGADGWTITDYPTGSHAVDTLNAMDGAKCLALTSTVLVNGGAYAESNEYKSVAEGDVIAVKTHIKASVVNISSKIEVVWYDAALSPVVPATAVYSTTNTPNTVTVVTGQATAPATARFYRVRINGAMPNVGTATGSVYFDGIEAGPNSVSDGSVTKAKLASAVAGTFWYPTTAVVYASTGSNSPTKVQEWVVGRAGTYTVRMNNYSTSPAWAYSQIYKNGVAYGASRQSVNNVGGVGTWDEDLVFAAGDAVQIYVWSGSLTYPAYAGGMIGESLSPLVTIRTV